MNNFKINKTFLGDKCKPYIIAEMSGNHNQSINKAIKIINAAAKCGANAIKIQTYTPNTITLKSAKKDFVIKSKNSLWSGYTLHDLYNKAYTNWDWISEIYKQSNKLGIDCFSSVFDETSVDFLENLNTPAYKIASFENNHIPLIRKAASTKKPLIISTGLATQIEIDEVVENARQAGCKKLALLKCTSDYPANPRDSNLLSIPFIKKKYKTIVGLSDHTKGIGTAIASIALGSSIIEKHFTLKRQNKSLDSEFSLNEKEFESLVIESERAYLSLGIEKFGSSKREKKSLQFRRSIYISQNIKKGETFTNKNIQIIRPGYSIHPRYYDKIIGLRSDKNYETGERINKSILSKIK